MLVLFDQKCTLTLEATTASPGLRMGGWTRQWKKQLIGVESIAQQKGALGPHSSHVHRGAQAWVHPCSPMPSVSQNPSDAALFVFSVCNSSLGKSPGEHSPSQRQEGARCRPR